ncbi:MAG TPA: glycerophosphodiester phosphodiesterase family protein [Rhizomicrobium sp.]|jgi:glycerophosphoryl diester phosphodiesterase|nr:glycerophosphodiester phosphodiesterase family protein [Rhizomicrobium sp.]
MSPLILAHRGGAALAPENTLCAFAHAIALGADGAELDVHLTGDGRVVVHHDYSLNQDFCRDARGAWVQRPAARLCDLRHSEIAHYDVGRARPGSEYARQRPRMIASDDERIPLLDDVLTLVRKAPKPFWLFIELKSSFLDPSLSAPPEVLAEATAAVLKSFGYLAQSAIIGFDWRGLLRAKALEPSLACWFSTYPQSWFGEGEPPHDHDAPPAPALALLRQWQRRGHSPLAAGFDAASYGGSVIQAVHAAGADGWFPHYSDTTEAAVKEAHACGLKVGAWTVDDAATMRVLAARGIDAICTDRPDLAVGL